MAKKKNGKSKSSNKPAVRQAQTPSQQTPQESLQGSQQQIIGEYSAVQTLGPIPAPNVLREYAAIQPDLPERIVSQWEKQSSHRQGLEARVVRSNIWNERLGTLSGTLIALAGIGAGTYLVSQGHDISGLVAFVATLAGIVRVFVIGTRRSREELQAKRGKLLPQ